MANPGAKKNEANSMQIEVLSEKDWQEAMKLKGILVLDVYQDWCGPCLPMLALLKRLKIDLGDDILHFGMVKADDLDHLYKYKGDSKPTWIFYATGDFLGVLKTTNAPQMTRVVKQLMDNARLILNEETKERKMVNDLLEENEKSGM